MKLRDWLFPRERECLYTWNGLQRGTICIWKMDGQTDLLHDFKGDDYMMMVAKLNGYLMYVQVTKEITRGGKN